MAKKLYDVAVKTGSYQTNGETKNRYENIGSVFDGDNGPYLILKRSFNPAGVPFKEGSDSVIVSLFKPKDDTAQSNGSYGAARTSLPVDDDVPF
jgi:hypothetical protein